MTGIDLGRCSECVFSGCYSQLEAMNSINNGVIKGILHNVAGLLVVLAFSLLLVLVLDGRAPAHRLRIVTIAIITALLGFGGLQWFLTT